ncbi:unnamed protein product [Anisakis simplex]|uniref:Adenylate kinase n=1 Tax=Anisakis simplex TaxID=6269 RepID=A0A0M3JQT4_ANISI|nr:unnamed protein product [Anisakis simplex]
MGCAPSLRTDTTDSTHSDRESDDDDQELIASSIPVQIDAAITSTPNCDLHRHKIIFFFGGPGSQKGVLIEEMVKEFNFVLINVEDVVFNYLPNKLANTIENSVQIQDLLKRDRKLLTVEWVLSVMSAKLSTSIHERFVIDIIPSLTSFLRSDSFCDLNQDKNLQNFESQHPIMCALQINVTDELNTLLNDTSTNNNQNCPEKSKEKELSPELSAFIRGVDEADKGRFEMNVNWVWTLMRIASKKYDSAILQQKHRKHSKLNCLKQIIAQKQFSKSSKAELSNLQSSKLGALRRYINKSSRATDNYLVLLDCINDGNESRGKRISFIETKLTYLDKYFKRTNSPRLKSVKRYFIVYFPLLHLFICCLQTINEMIK